MKTKIILSFFFTFCFTVVSVLATPEEADMEANRIAGVLEDQGWDVRSTFTRGTLDIGESYTFSATFYAGNRYVLVAGGCSYAKDVDLYVYDGYGNLIDQDRDAAKHAIVYFTPTVSGTFYVKVKMYDAYSNGVHWSLVYGYK